MVFWGVSVRSERPLVGCFCTVALVHELREAFGATSSATGRISWPATASGPSARPPGWASGRTARWSCGAVRNEVQFGPRHAFRLRVGPGAFVSGTLDRYSVRVECEREADFPEPVRGRFLAFLSSLQLGGVRMDGV